MNEQPNIGHPSNATGESPTRDPALADIQTAPTQTISPSGDTISPDSTRPDSGPPDAMPDLSIATGSSTLGKQAAPEPPKLDGYNVVIPIGEGGMGTVWRAVQLSTRRTVALKLISAAGFASDRARQRFDREVEITARLEHPNIARVYDSGINRGIYFYAMELIDGVPLDQYVSRHHLSRRDILRLFAIVCRAVDHAHQRGVIHRDLKPGNILVTLEGQPHVLDFGLAKALEQAGKEAGISIDGEVAGTPGFMSPEQAAGKIDLDARCDVYSLGVILYRLLTGQPPHDLSGTYLDILRRVSEEEPKRPRAADRTMDRELEALLLRALQRDPSHRYKTAGELAQDVESYVQGDPITAKPPTLTYFLRKRARKHRVKIVTSAIVVVLLGLATLLTVRLVRAHLNAKVDAKNLELQKQGKYQANVQAAIAVGNKLVSDGDVAVAAAKWAEARAAYVSAEKAFKDVGASTLRADLGLWNLERMAPSPLNTILPIKTSATATSLAILPDNRRALVGYDDGDVRLFDIATGHLLQTVATGLGTVHAIAASADSTAILVGGDSGSLKLWDLASGTLKHDFHDAAVPLTNRVTHVALSPDGRLALSISGASPELLAAPDYNDTVTMWDVTTGQVLLRTDRTAKILDANQTITSASFSPDSSMLLTASAQVVVWNVKDGKQKAWTTASAMAAAFSSDGRLVAAGTSDGAVYLLNVGDGRISTPWKHASAIQAIGFDSRDSRIITVSEDGAFCAIDLEGHELWSQPSRGDLDCVALSNDGSLAFSASGADLCIWPMSQPPEMRDIGVGDSFADHVKISSDGRLIAAVPGHLGGQLQRAWVVDSMTGFHLAPAFPFNAPCFDAVLSSDGRTLVQGNARSIWVWSLDPPHKIAEFPNEGAGWLLAISNDGTKVAVSTDKNCSVLVFNVQEQSKKLLSTGYGTQVVSAAFSPDGRTLLIGNDDRTADFWNVDSSANIAVLRGHQARVNAVAVSDDGKLAVTASGVGKFETGNDNTVRTWELPSGKPLLVLKGHTARVNTVAITGDGRLIASGSDDGTVILWDGVSGDVLRTVNISHGAVLALSVDQAGQHLVCGSNDALTLLQLHRPAEQRELESALVAVRAKDASAALTPQDYRTLGRWYAFREQGAWACALFQLADAGGVKVPPAERWRCEWQAGDLAAAEKDLKLIPAQDAPPYYVNLCVQAMHK